MDKPITVRKYASATKRPTSCPWSYRFRIGRVDITHEMARQAKDRKLRTTMNFTEQDYLNVEKKLGRTWVRDEARMPLLKHEEGY